VTEGDRIPLDRNNFDRIRQSFCRIPTRILSEFDGTRLKSDQIRPGFHRVPSNYDEIRVGIRLKGIRQKLCRIRSVFYEKCRIPMKSDADPIENDRICRSDLLSWVVEMYALPFVLLFQYCSDCCFRFPTFFQAFQEVQSRFKKSQNL